MTLIEFIGVKGLLIIVALWLIEIHLWIFQIKPLLETMNFVYNSHIEFSIFFGLPILIFCGEVMVYWAETKGLKHEIKKDEDSTAN